jgi:hypothetical protein
MQSFVCAEVIWISRISTYAYSISNLDNIRLPRCFLTCFRVSSTDRQHFSLSSTLSVRIRVRKVLSQLPRLNTDNSPWFPSILTNVLAHDPCCDILGPLLDEWMNDHFLGRKESLARRWMKFNGDISPSMVNLPELLWPITFKLSHMYYCSYARHLGDYWCPFNEERFTRTAAEDGQYVT